MNTEQLRADFEAWYMREFEAYPRRNESGGFKSQYVNAMFKAWKAGRAALQSQDRDALREIANWPNGGKRYGQEKIKDFARRRIEGEEK